MGYYMCMYTNDDQVNAVKSAQTDDQVSELEMTDKEREEIAK